MSKAPEKLLSVPELVAYTGFQRQTLQSWMTDPQVWAVPGGAKMIGGEYRLPVGFYNAWVESRDVAAPAGKKGAGRA